MGLKILLSFFVFIVFTLMLQAQSINISIKLDTIYTNLDSIQCVHHSELQKSGYKEVNGQWINSSGELLFVSQIVLTYPQYDLFKEIEGDLRKLEIRKGLGSIIFAVDSKGKVDDFYLQETGDKVIQNSVKQTLIRKGRWSTGILSGRSGRAIYKLSVVIQ